MLVAGPGVPPPGGVKRAMFALLMMETLVCASRYIRLMYWPRWNSPATVVAGPGFVGKSGWSWVGFQGVHVAPSSSTPAGFPPRPLLGLPCGGVVAGLNPAAVETEPVPCATALKPCGVFVLE